MSGYLQEGERSTDWLAKGVIKQHRTMATYVRLLLRQGFRLTQLEEWGPTPRNKLRPNPRLRLNANARPFFCSPRSKQAWTCRAEGKANHRTRNKSSRGRRATGARPSGLRVDLDVRGIRLQTPTPGNV